MDRLLTIALEAHSDELNHHRRYELMVGRDLLDHWTVTVRYGRVGQPARVLRFGGPDREAMRRLLQDRLRRRLSAPKRIGCAYRVREFSAAAGIRSEDWVPGSMIAPLFGAA